MTDPEPVAAGTAAAASVPCPACGADIDPAPGPIPPVLGAPPGCWRLFRDLLRREYGDAERWPVSAWSTDAYAVQHPGSPGPRQAHSVAIHLVGLCLRLERGLDGEDVRRAVARLTDKRTHFPWLPPPSSPGCPVTVADVLRTGSPDDHRAMVRRWATTTWEAWAEHHETVRTFLVVEQ